MQSKNVLGTYVSVNFTFFKIMGCHIKNWIVNVLLKILYCKYSLYIYNIIENKYSLYKYFFIYSIFLHYHQNYFAKCININIYLYKYFACLSKRLNRSSPTFCSKSLSRNNAYGRLKIFLEKMSTFPNLKVRKFKQKNLRTTSNKEKLQL